MTAADVTPGGETTPSTPFRFVAQDMGRTLTGTWTVAADVYRDPDRFDREVTAVLASTWTLAAHSSELRPGCHLVWQGFGQTVVISRRGLGERHGDDPDARPNTLTAFHNVCQHRGARIVDHSGETTAAGFRCPWHGWTYDASGRLIGVPRRELFDAAACSSAPPVAVTEWGGFVWINLDAAAEPLESYLDELADELGGYGMSTWILAGADHWTIPTNWKAVVDGFSEDYHAHITHRRTIPSGLDFNDTRWTLFDRHSMMVTPFARTNYAALTQPIDQRHTAYSHYAVFPTTIASCFPTHAQIMSVTPIDVDTTELRVWIVGACAEGDEKRHAQLVDGFHHFCAIASEDVGVLSELAATRHSIAYRTNVFGTAEPRLHLFHSTVDALLAR